jgi:hypothetical protein
VRNARRAALQRSESALHPIANFLAVVDSGIERRPASSQILKMKKIPMFGRRPRDSVRLSETVKTLRNVKDA